MILGVQLQGVADGPFESSLVELERLAETLGLRVTARVCQKRSGLSGTVVVGEGKLAELARHTGGPGAVPGYSPAGSRSGSDRDTDDDDPSQTAEEEEVDEGVAGDD